MAQSISGLVHGEMALARAEMGENARRATRGVMMIAGACVLGVVALNLLAGAAVAAFVAHGLAAGWAAALVGGGLFFVAALLVHEGLGAFDRTSFIPRRTVENLRRDAAHIKEMIHDPSQ